MSGALAGLVILMIGDSHMAFPDYLISAAHDALEAEGAVVNSYGMCGAMAVDWVLKVTTNCEAERHGLAAPVFGKKIQPTWLINDLLEQTHPNLVIVELGDTMAGYDKPDLPKGWIYDQVHQLTGRIAARNVSCVWVGPLWGRENSPYHKANSRVREMSQFLAQAVAPCLFIDSTQFARPGELPTTDGQHLTPAGYRKWAAGIATAIAAMRSQVH